MPSVRRYRGGRDGPRRGGVRVRAARRVVRGGLRPRTIHHPGAGATGALVHLRRWRRSPVHAGADAVFATRRRADHVHAIRRDAHHAADT